MVKVMDEVLHIPNASLFFVDYFESILLIILDICFTLKEALVALISHEVMNAKQCTLRLHYYLYANEITPQLKM